MNPSPEKRLAYSPRTFAQAAGVSTSTAYQLIKTGELPAKVLNATSQKPRYLIPADAAEAWLDSLAAA